MSEDNPYLDASWVLPALPNVRKKKTKPTVKPSELKLTDEEKENYRQLGWLNMVHYWRRELLAIHRGIDWHESGLTGCQIKKLRSEGILEFSTAPKIRYGRECMWSITPRARQVLRTECT